MLSAWFNVTQLYLSRDLCLLSVGENAHLSVEVTEPENISDILKRLDVEISSSQTKLGKRLRVMLSGALAPAVPLQIPAEVQRWEERFAILQVAAQQEFALANMPMWVQLERCGLPLGAAIAKETSDAIAQWSEAHGLRLQSIRPIWSVASSAPGLQSQSCKGLLINEPDGSLLLVEQDGQWSQFYQGADMPLQARESVFRRIKLGLNLREHDVITLHFGEKSAKPDGSLPKSWNAYWSEA